MKNTNYIYKEKKLWWNIIIFPVNIILIKNTKKTPKNAEK